MLPDPAQGQGGGADEARRVAQRGSDDGRGKGRQLVDQPLARATRASFAPTPPARMIVSGSMMAQIEAAMAAIRLLSSSTSATPGASLAAAR